MHGLSQATGNDFQDNPAKNAAAQGKNLASLFDETAEDSVFAVDPIAPTVHDSPSARSPSWEPSTVHVAPAGAERQQFDVPVPLSSTQDARENVPGANPILLASSCHSSSKEGKRADRATLSPPTFLQFRPPPPPSFSSLLHQSSSGLHAAEIPEAQQSPCTFPSREGGASAALVGVTAHQGTCSTAPSPTAEAAPSPQEFTYSNKHDTLSSTAPADDSTLGNASNASRDNALQANIIIQREANDGNAQSKVLGLCPPRDPRTQMQDCSSNLSGVMASQRPELPESPPLQAPPSPSPTLRDQQPEESTLSRQPRFHGTSVPTPVPPNVKSSFRQISPPPLATEPPAQSNSAFRSTHGLFATTGAVYPAAQEIRRPGGGAALSFGFGGRMLTSCHAHCMMYRLRLPEASEAASSTGDEELEAFPGPLSQTTPATTGKILEWLGHLLLRYNNTHQEVLIRLLRGLIMAQGDVKNPALSEELAPFLMGVQLAAPNSPLANHPSRPPPTSLPQPPEVAGAAMQKIAEEGAEMSAEHLASSCAEKKLFDHALAWSLIHSENIGSSQFAGQPGIFKETFGQFCDGFGKGGPAVDVDGGHGAAVRALRTLYSLMSGKDVSVTQAVLACWPAEVALVCRHLLGTPQAGRFLAKLGDFLQLHLRDTAGAHLCYILGGTMPESVGSLSTRLTLIGVDHRETKNFSRLTDPIFVQLTEVFDYAMRLRNPRFCSLSLQPFVVAMTRRLCDVGLFSKAHRYVQFTNAVMKTAPASHFHDFFREAVKDLQAQITAQELALAEGGSSGSREGLMQDGKDSGDVVASLWGGLKGIATTLKLNSSPTDDSRAREEHRNVTRQDEVIRNVAACAPIPPISDRMRTSPGDTASPPSLTGTVMPASTPYDGSASANNGTSCRGNLTNDPPLLERPQSGSPESGTTSSGGLLGGIMGSLKKAFQSEERNVGVENTFYYDEVKKRWIDKSRPDAASPKTAASPTMPPPPTAGPPPPGGTQMGSNPLLQQGGVRSRYVDVFGTKPTSRLIEPEMNDPPVRASQTPRPQQAPPPTHPEWPAQQTPFADTGPTPPSAAQQVPSARPPSHPFASPPLAQQHATAPREICSPQYPPQPHGR